MLVRVASNRSMSAVASSVEIEVNENEYSFLTLLANKSTVSKADVVNAVWGCRGILVTDSSYYQLIHSLRKKLSLIGMEGALKTLPRRGLQVFICVELTDVMSIPVNGQQVVDLLGSGKP
jgi:DNA-binding winged helix-turn-helix (wHTH) protein